MRYSQSTLTKTRTNYILGIASCLIICISHVGVAIATISIGVGWDEEIETRWLGRAFEAEIGSFRENSNTPTQSEFVSGLAFQWLAHFANILRGNEIFGSPGFEAENYAVRHMIVYLVYFFGALALGIAAYRVTGRLPASLYAVAAYSVLPVFSGHASFNHKDIPAAVGFTCFSAGLTIMASDTIQKRATTWKAICLTSLLLTFGWFMAVGVRFALFAVLLLAFLVTVLFVAYKVCYSSGNDLVSKWRLVLLPYFATSLFSVVLGSLLIYVAHPNLRNHFLDLPYETLIASGSFGQQVWTLTAGHLIPSQAVPWWYLPTWVLAGTPLLLLIVCLFGILASFLRKSDFPIFFPFLWQLFFLPIVTIIFSSPMYDGQRHSLYIFPALAFFGGVSALKLLSFNPTSTLQSMTKSIGLASLVLAIALPLHDSIRLHPYRYVYTNPLVALLPGNLSKWETDYWGLSLREGIQKVPARGVLSIWGVSGSFTPYLHLRASEKLGGELATNEFWWLKHERNGEAIPMPSSCIEVFQTTRSTWYRTFRLNTIYRCTESI